MCGIAGIISTDPTVASERRVRLMLASLSHRGPDDEGIASVSGATIGARRLSVIDVLHGHQPMTSEDGSVIAVQNGELYDFRAIRLDLASRGHHFETDNDTEILPHAYEEHAEAAVERLRGMFALAIWDVRRRRLILARDRLGKKPLVYAQRGGSLYFASEIQALLTLPEIGREVDEDAIAEYLTLGYVPAPRTAFRGIRKLEPGEVLTFEGGTVAKRRYWSPSFEPKAEIGFSEAAERLRSAIDEAVRIRLISDVPLGALLSGGLDSSTIVAFMSRHSTGPVRTFSIGFTDADYDEVRYARIVARHFGTEHHEFVVEPAAAEILPTLVRHFGEPFADSSAIPTYYVARMARKHVTVVLTGDGGDELFGGYDRYRAVALAGLVDAVPSVRVLLGGAARALPASASRRLLPRAQRFLSALALPGDRRYLRWIGYFTGEALEDIATPSLSHGALSVDFLTHAADRAGARDAAERAMAADLLTYLPGDLLVKMDIATMACSLEARSPLLDHRVVELVSSLPRAYKVSLTKSKILLREAMRGILPVEVLTRGKMGFGVPVGRWLRGPLRELLTDVLLSDTALSRGYLRPAGVRALVEEHLSGAADRTPHVWSLLMLELWFRHCADAPHAADPAMGPSSALSTR